MLNEITNGIFKFSPIIAALLPILSYRMAYNKKVKMLLNAAKNVSTDGPKTKIIPAKFIQQIDAKNDKSQLITIGLSTGTLSDLGDYFAPDGGKDIKLSVNDLTTHFIVFGSTGTGKTSGLLRPIISQLIQYDDKNVKTNIDLNKRKYGIMVADGKGQLALDFIKVLDVSIHPDYLKNFNVIENIQPEILADTLFKLNDGEKSSDPFWPNSARDMIYYAAVILNVYTELGLRTVTVSDLVDIMSLITTKPEVDETTNKISHEIKDVMSRHNDYAEDGTIVNDAIKYFRDFQINNPDDTRNSIFAVARSWLAPFFQSEKLRNWAECDKSDFVFDDILNGLRIGLLLPENEFGAAGLIVTALLKARLYKLIQSRGDSRDGKNNKQVFLVIDEAQKVIDDLDLAILPIARSLKLSCIYATQNIEGIVNRFNEQATLQLLDSFGSILSYRSSAGTLKYIQERIGNGEIWLSQHTTQKSMDIASSAENLLKSVIYDLNNPYASTIQKKFGGMHDDFSEHMSSNVLSPKESNKIQSQNGGEMSSHFSYYEKLDQPRPFFNEDGMQLLNQKFNAIVILNRAGVPRRDIIKTYPLDNNFNKIITEEQIKEERQKEVKKELGINDNILDEDFSITFFD